MFRDVPGCSGMFRVVPGCSGKFRDVPCSWFYRRPCLIMCNRIRQNLNDNMHKCRAYPELNSLSLARVQLHLHLLS